MSKIKLSRAKVIRINENDIIVFTVPSTFSIDEVDEMRNRLRRVPQLKLQSVLIIPDNMKIQIFKKGNKSK